MSMSTPQGEELDAALTRAAVMLQAAYALLPAKVTLTSIVADGGGCVGSLRARYPNPSGADWDMLIYADGRVAASNASGSRADFPDLGVALEVTILSVLTAASIG